MRTYKEFITELNKFEAAMAAGKIGLKTLKKLGVNTSGYNYMKAFGKGSINKKIPKVPKAELVGGPHNIGMRNFTGNPFTSMRRSAENQLRSYQLLGPGQTGKYNTFRNKFGDELYYDTTKGRHKDLRNVGKRFNRQAYADMKHKYLDGDKGAKKAMDAIKDMGDANRQLSKPPLGTTPIGTRPNEMIKSSFPRTIEKRKMKDLLNKEKLGIEPKYGDKPTTANIKKGSIPEPKKKNNKK